MKLKGQARPLFASGIASTISSGDDIGTFATGAYARVSGLFSTVGSMTIRYRMGIDSSNLLVSSSFVVNSGPGLFDVLNYGRFTNFAVTAAISGGAATTFMIQGEPTR